MNNSLAHQASYSRVTITSKLHCDNFSDSSLQNNVVIETLNLLRRTLPCANELFMKDLHRYSTEVLN